MQTRYFSFGQGHAHRFAGETLDPNVLVRITDKDPRAKMFELFGRVWAEEYETLGQAGFPKYYPRGLFDINNGEFVNA